MIFLYLILLNVMHLAADYTPLSTKWMLKAKQFGTPLFPIFCHAGVHAILFFLATLLFKSILVALMISIIQLVSHFLIDVAKGKLNFKFPIFQSSMNVQHWTLFGTDQFAHQTIIILSAYLTNIL